MSRNRLLKGLVLVFVTIIAVSAGYTVYAKPDAQEAPMEADLTFEVAEDGNRFVFTQDRLFPDGLPDYGTAFVTQGYIYPEGTLNGSNGVLPDGQPEFPDLVVGEWTCYGWMIGEGAHSTTGQWVISTQVYELNEEYDNAIIITDGFELADINVPAARAITGGTGAYATARGEHVQTLLGFTEQMGVNLTVEFHIVEN